jgi:hypothetical protein
VNSGSDPTLPASGAMSDEDLQQLLCRAQRIVMILALLLLVVFTATMSWQSGLLELAGGIISWTGIREWRTLARLVSATLDNKAAPNPMGRTLGMFFLRLAFVGGLLYVSLKCLHGSVYALVAGIALAVVALSIEASRLHRQ